MSNFQIGRPPTTARGRSFHLARRTPPPGRASSGALNGPEPVCARKSVRAIIRSRAGSLHLQRPKRSPRPANSNPSCHPHGDRYRQAAAANLLRQDAEAATKGYESRLATWKEWPPVSIKAQGSVASSLATLADLGQVARGHIGEARPRPTLPKGFPMQIGLLGIGQIALRCDGIRGRVQNSSALCFHVSLEKMHGAAPARKRSWQAQPSRRHPGHRYKQSS